MNDDDLKKFAAYRSFSQAEEDSWVARGLSRTKPSHRNTVQDTGTIRDTIIREGGAFLDGLERDESYSDYVLDEIDRIILSGRSVFNIPGLI